MAGQLLYALESLKSLVFSKVSLLESQIMRIIRISNNENQ
jgi:hypothetical protein